VVEVAMTAALEDCVIPATSVAAINTQRPTNIDGLTFLLFVASVLKRFRS